MKRSKGFTLVELLVVVGIIAMLVGILMPTLGRAREIAQMSMCGANLNGIGKGVIMYQAEAEDKFPLLGQHTSGANLMVALNSGTDNDDIANLNSNAMQNAWVMIQKGSISEELLKCPSDKSWTARKDVTGETGTQLKKYGWNSWNNFSFGIHMPYGQNHASPLTSSLKGSFPIFADKNYQEKGEIGSVYYTTSSQSRKPGNHPRDGFNFLTYGASCSKQRYTEGVSRRFSACGVGNDDIYVSQDSGGTGTYNANASLVPNTDSDCFILPWQEGGGNGGPGV